MIIVDKKPSDALKFLMGSMNVIQKELETRTGLSRATVQRHVSGQYQPTLDDREKYAAVFGMTVEQFDALWAKPTPALPPLEQTPVTGRAVALRNQLTTRHITVKELAKRSGIAATVIDPMLRAAAPISDSMVNRLMDAMALIERERMLKIPEHEGVKPNGDKGSSRAAG